MRCLFRIEQGEGEEYKEFRKFDNVDPYGYGTIYGALMACLEDCKIDMEQPMKFTLYYQNYNERETHATYTFEDENAWYLDKRDILKPTTIFNRSSIYTLKFIGFVAGCDKFGYFSFISDDCTDAEDRCLDYFTPDKMVSGTPRAFWFIRHI